jgi:parallel beta-helix repeat protein
MERILSSRAFPLLLAAVLAAGLSSTWATDRCGEVGGETWTTSGSPYVVTCDVTVAAATTLTIEAGVEVRFQAGYGLEVFGTLDVNGASGTEVVFTSDAGSPGTGDWREVELQSSAVGTIDEATIEFATHGIRVTGSADLTANALTVSQCIDGVYVSGGVATLTDVTANDNSSTGVYVNNSGSTTLSGVTAQGNGYGLYIYDSSAGSTVDVTSSTLTGNSLYGVYVWGSGSQAPSLTIHGSSIHSNLGGLDFVTGGFVNPGQQVVDVTGNWWNTTDEALIRSRIHDHANHPTAPIVDWCGYLDGEGGSAARDVHCPDPAVCDETAVWNLTDKPHLLYSDVVVCPTGVLQIGPGVLVQAVPDPGVGIEVQGQLDVNGVTGNEAVFTSGAGTPAAGDWQGVELQPTSVGSIEDAMIFYATDGAKVTGAAQLTATRLTASQCVNGISVSGGGATLTDVSSNDNSSIGVDVNQSVLTTLSGVTAQGNGYGLYVYDHSSSSTVSVTSSTFTDNSIYGVYAYGSGAQAPALAIHGSSIHSNSAYELVAESFVNAGQQVVDATGNWWNTTDEELIRDRIYDHANFLTAPIVDWCGHLDGEGGTAARDVYCPDLAVCDETAVWSLTDKPYLLSSDVVVCPTGTLEVGPGVSVRTARHPGAGIEVEGQLDVGGLSGDEAVFTSDSGTPGPGYWQGVELRSSGVGTIDDATIAYAVDGALVTGSADLTANALTVSQCSGRGVGVSGAAAVLSLTGSTVTQCANGVSVYQGVATATDVTSNDNSQTGFYVQDSGSTTLTGVTAQGNGYGLYVSDYSSSSTVEVASSTLTDNDAYGVYAYGASTRAPALTIHGSSIHSNLGSYDLMTQSFVNPTSSIVWVPDNWWGTTDHEEIVERIWDHGDHPNSPHVSFRPFGDACEMAICNDRDRDGHGDFVDNCPFDSNVGQADDDNDGMGNPCDPDPGVQPTGPCNGIDDVTDGYVDADADGWGDPCDFRPTHADCYPGAPELCDGRDNDGDGQFLAGELSDADLDGGLTCGDCDDAEPEVHLCACENCYNVREDDCDGLMDINDPECFEYPYCVVITAGTPPDMDVGKNACGGASSSGPFDVIRGFVDQLQLVSGSVDLGDVTCVAGGLVWDRVTAMSANPDPTCNDTKLYFVAQDTGAADYGSAHPGGEPRDVMNPDPACP